MKRIIWVLALSLLFAPRVFSQQFPEPMSPPRIVNDFAKALTQSENEMLEAKLRGYRDTTSTEIAIVIISTLDGYPIDDYAIQLANRWKIGKKGSNNGVLIFIALDDHKIFIPTGYGVEGALPDGLVKRIIEQDIKPEFREGRYYEGLNKATDDMILLLAGEYEGSPEEVPVSVPFFIVFGVFALIITLMLVIKTRSAKNYARLNNIPFWVAWTLLNQATRRHHGSWGGFSGGSSWGSGGGGGSSFGGFGGGSFGGGGAGGSW